MDNNKTRYRYLTLASLVLILAPLVPGQIAGAVGTASTVASTAPAADALNAINTATTGASVSLPSTVAHTSAAAINGASIQTNPPTAPGLNVSARPGVDAANAPRTPGTIVGASASNRIAASLDTARTTVQLRGASGQGRDPVYARIEASIATASHALAEVRRNTTQLRAEARAQLTAAVNEARAREQDLRQSLREARQAGADTSAAANAKLAANYEAYADAVAHAEAAVHTSANATGAMNRQQ